MYLICHWESTSIGLIVDRVGEVISIDPAKVEQAPSNVQGHATELIEGTYPTEQGLILLLDIPRACELILNEINSA